MPKYKAKDFTLVGTTHGAVGYFKRIAWSGASCGVIDVTDSSSTNHWREKISGIKDAGQITLTIQYDKTLLASLLTALGTEDSWTLTFPCTSTLVVTGFIQAGPGGEGELESGIDGTLTIELSGAPAFTAAT